MTIQMFRIILITMLVMILVLTLVIMIIQASLHTHSEGSENPFDDAFAI